MQGTACRTKYEERNCEACLSHFFPDCSIGRFFDFFSEVLMATSGRPLPIDVRNSIVRLLRERISLRKIARHCGVCVATVYKVKRRYEASTMGQVANLP